MVQVATDDVTHHLTGTVGGFCAVSGIGALAMHDLEEPVSEPTSFAGQIRGIVSELRTAGPTHSALNRASSGIDQLGRRLYGLGYVRSREIADCFTAALADLDASHAVPEETRTEGVRRAIDRLEGALEHAAAGILPDRPDPPERPGAAP
jgi:hypothetical protein